MYINMTIIKIIIAIMFLGSLYIGAVLIRRDDMSRDLRKFLDILAVILMIASVFLGSWFGMFSTD